MLENLVSLVRECAGEAIINNPAVPNEQNEAVITAASHSIEAGLQNMISQGKFQDLLTLFHNGMGNTSNNPADKSFNLEGIISHLTNGQGLNNLLGGLTGNNVAEGLMDKVKGLFAHS
jgi:hypothetical protein